MADTSSSNKRGSIGGRVATPKVKPNSDVVELDTALSKSIGCRVKVTVAPQNVVYEGTLFTACPITNLIAINTSSSGAINTATPSTYHVIPVSHLLNFQLLGDATGTNSLDSGIVSLSKQDLDGLKHREEVAVRKLKEQEANRGKGVSKEAQEIFDFIKRTLPAYWYNKSIIVNDTVRINEPYRSEDCIASKDKEKSLVQIKKIVDAFHVRRASSVTPTIPNAQGSQQGRSPVPATPNVPRKGG